MNKYQHVQEAELSYSNKKSYFLGVLSMHVDQTPSAVKIPVCNLYKHATISNVMASRGTPGVVILSMYPSKDLPR